MAEPEHDAAEWAEWEEFVSEYSQGKVGRTGIPQLPKLIERVRGEVKEKGLIPAVCDLDTPHPNTPKGLYDFYCAYHFLPSPVPTNESERQQVLDIYRIGRQGRLKELNELAQLASDVFDDGAMVMITAVLKDKITLLGVGTQDQSVDWDNIIRLTPTQVQTCRHNMLGEVGDNQVFANRALDWRIQDSPLFAQQGGDMGLIVSSRINLPSPSGRDLPIGNVCILRAGANAKPWTARDSGLLTRFARRARSEILNAHDRLHVQPRRADQIKFVSSFIQRDLGSRQTADLDDDDNDNDAPHSPQASTSTSTSTSTVKSATASPPGSISMDRGPSTTAQIHLFDRAISRAAKVVDASSAVLLDVRELAKASAFKLDAISRGSTRKQGSTLKQSSVEAEGNPSRPHSPADIPVTPSTLKQIGLLGTAPTGCRPRFEQLLKKEDFLRPLQRSLAVISSHNQNASEVLTQALSSVLPETRETTVVIPVFDHSGVPALALIVTSDLAQAFDSGDRNFIERVGHLCLAALVKDQALASERAKLAFVAKISHELRTPMHGLAGQIGLIRDAYTSSGPTEQSQKLEPMLKVADLCLSSLQSICDDSLVFAKLSNETNYQNDEDDDRIEVVDVAGLCSTTAKSVWVRKMKQVSVNQNEANGDEAEAETVEVILDFKPQQNGWLANVNAASLRRVIANVLTNAYTFTENGWVRLTMDTEPHVDDKGRRSLEITVSDSGKGIPRSFLQSGDIWLPFRQADSFSKGSGLGLSIVRELLNRLGGAISITSELGQGTTVVISVPLEFQQGGVAQAEVQVLSDELSAIQPAAKPEDGPVRSYGRSSAHSRASSPTPPIKENGASPDPPIRPPPNPTLTVRPPSSTSLLPASRPLNILIAEDNAVSRNILAKLLSKKGYKYHAVEDGQKAVDVFEQRGNEFDISLMDVQMPVKDGIEASFDIRKIEKANGWPRHRIVALSGLSNPEDLALALDNDGPMDAWLVKGGSSLRDVTEELARMQKELKRQA